MTREPRIRLGLNAIRSVCAALGNPQLAVPSVLIAGTNGKGSTASFLASIAQNAGLRVGVFRSPSLGAEHEHIALGTKPMPSQRFVELQGEVENAAKQAQVELSAFETLTATAFLAFAREKVDLAVIEAGLGGARDATNVAEPQVSLLVSVDLDHREFLGSSIAEIATDKAGVFRAGRPAILGWLESSALEVARGVADQLGAEILVAADHVSIDAFAKNREAARNDEAAGDGAALRTRTGVYTLRPGLKGDHQVGNATLAVLAAETLRERFPGLDRDACERGISKCRFPGRLEWCRARAPAKSPGEEQPGDYEYRILLDAAHNPAAARALARYLDQLNERCDLLFGAFADKDALDMLKILRPRVGRIWLTPWSHPRSWRPFSLELAGEWAWVDSPADGLRQALSPSRPPLVVAGSVSLIAHVRSLLSIR